MCLECLIYGFLISKLWTSSAKLPSDKTEAKNWQELEPPTEMVKTKDFFLRNITLSHVFGLVIITPSFSSFSEFLGLNKQTNPSMTARTWKGFIFDGISLWNIFKCLQMVLQKVFFLCSLEKNCIIARFLSMSVFFMTMCPSHAPCAMQPVPSVKVNARKDSWILAPIFLNLSELSFA